MFYVFMFQEDAQSSLRRVIHAAVGVRRARCKGRAPAADVRFVPTR